MALVTSWLGTTNEGGFDVIDSQWEPSPERLRRDQIDCLDVSGRVRTCPSTLPISARMIIVYEREQMREQAFHSVGRDRLERMFWVAVEGTVLTNQ